MAAKTAPKPCTCSLVVTFTKDDEPQTTGCTATTRRTFAPGHDARLKGFLIRAGIADQLVRIGDDVNTSPEAIAEQFGFAYMVRTGIKNGKEKAAKKAFAEVVRGVKAEAKKNNGKGKLMRNTKAKVGRWEYRGQVREIGDQAWFCYTDKQGNAKETRSYTEV